MQTQEQPQAEIVKHRMMAVSAIKKVTDKIVSAEPININLFLVIFISGLGELLKISFGWTWCLLVLAIVIIFALDKFEILKKKEEVIIRREAPNSFNE